MLTEELLEKIYSGEIDSRVKLYRIVGRSKKLRLWLDENDLLVPRWWDEQTIITRMRDFQNKHGRLPRASDDWNLTKRAQERFGSWNEAMFRAFGVYNQRRYDSYTDEELLEIVRNFVKHSQRLPMRSEFDGSKYPYFEVYTSRFGVSKWRDILAMAGVDRIKHFPSKHGWGSMRRHNGKTYLSHQEYLIGRYLDDQGIEFEQEVPYGNSSHSFDFYLPSFDVYIEYYGIREQDYLDRIEVKRSLYGSRRVIEIFKHENTVGKLALEVQRL